MKQRISAYILSSLLLLLPLRVLSQEKGAQRSKPALLQGMSILTEVGTPIAHVLGGDVFGLEAAFRVNLRNHYFPIAEVGYGKYDATNDETHLTYKANAPYFRLGCDVNMLKDKTQNNRLLVGGRLGYSPYSFDASGPSVKDPIWGTDRPLDISSPSLSRVWLEITLGLEAEIARNFHLQLGVRYRTKLSETAFDQGTPYYVPGFGAMGDSGFALTYNLIFDLSKKIIKQSTPK